MRMSGRNTSSGSTNTPTKTNSCSNNSEGDPAAVAILAASVRPSPTTSRNTSAAEPSTETFNDPRKQHLMSKSRPRSGSSSGRSNNSSSSSSHRRNSHSSNHKPVDLDDIYDGKLDLYVDDSNSDGSVGEASSANDGTPLEGNRMSALVHTMAQKQQFISETFFEMIGSMSKMMLSMEEQMLAIKTTSQSEFDHDNHQESDCGVINTKIHIAKAQARAHRNVQKALEMQEHALAMKTKQARIAQQFETLVHRLEQESLETSLHNQSLKRQLQMARVLLRDEAGVEMEDISEAASSSQHAAHSTGGARGTPLGKSSSSRSSHNSRRPPLSVRRAVSVPCNRSSPDGKTAVMSMHPIKEIAFSNTVVDVTEMSNSQVAAAAEENSCNKNINNNDDDDDDHHDLILKESHSSEEPLSQRTATTVTTSTTVTTTAAENLRFLL